MPSQEKFPFPHDQRKDSRAHLLPGSSTLILTIGHSTHSMEAFIDLLQAHGVKRLVDFLSFPRSRRIPPRSGDRGLLQRRVTASNTKLSKPH
jgi:hypothetical protein